MSSNDIFNRQTLERVLMQTLEQLPEGAKLSVIIEAILSNPETSVTTLDPHVASRLAKAVSKALRRLQDKGYAHMIPGSKNWVAKESTDGVVVLQVPDVLGCFEDLVTTVEQYSDTQIEFLSKTPACFEHGTWDPEHRRCQACPFARACRARQIDWLSLANP